MGKRYERTRSTVNRGVPNPLVLGRKFCGRCGRWRLACDFRPEVRTSSGLSTYCYACNRIIHRQRRARRTPEQRARDREYQRFWTEVKRRRRGVPPRQYEKKSSAVDRRDRVFLDTAPLIEALKAYHLEQTLVNEATGSWRLLAEKAGVTDRTINRYLRGESKHVALSQADRLAHALGIPLALLYPHGEAA